MQPGLRCEELVWQTVWLLHKNNRFQLTHASKSFVQLADHLPAARNDYVLQKATLLNLLLTTQ